MVLPNIAIACVFIGAAIYAIYAYNRSSTEQRGLPYQYHSPDDFRPEPSSSHSDQQNDESLRQRQRRNSTDDCAICVQNMMNGTSRRLRCGHVYHVECIANWFQLQRTCPLCRAASQ